MKKPNRQIGYLLRYLAQIPVLTVVVTAVAVSIWMIFNYFYPDFLFYP